LDLVGDDDVGVQLRITSAAVVVVERRGDHPGDIHLGDRPVRPGRADPRGGDLTLDQADDVVDGGVVRRHDLAAGVGVGEGPQRRHALRDREGEVVPGDRPTRPPRLLLRRDSRHRGRELGRVEVRVEGVGAGGDPLGGRDEPRVRPTQRRPRCRVASLAQQQSHEAPRV
jgi:hypothetical protein